jgi:phosphohistidine phosphatase
MDVYLVRHAIAERRDPDRWPDDAARPLTARGSKRFRQAAGGLRRIAPHVEAVLSSPYPRAWQTAEILADVAGWPTAESCPALQAGRPPTEAAEMLRERKEPASLALVGHEPHLSTLASLLLAGTADVLRLDLKKGGVVLLSFDGDSARGQATLRWCASPRMLRAIAG